MLELASGVPRSRVEIRRLLRVHRQVVELGRCLGIGITGSLVAQVFPVPPANANHLCLIEDEESIRSFDGGSGVGQVGRQVGAIDHHPFGQVGSGQGDQGGQDVDSGTDFV